MNEAPTDYVTESAEALDMLGAGYAAEIESPRIIKRLSDEGLRDYKVWGWVKISANFISHIKRLKGAKLAVWQVVALSINEDGECNLSVPQIAEASGYSQSETRKTLGELDEMGYLSVDRKAGKRSLYTPEFVARAGKKPTLRPKDDPTRKDTPLVGSLVCADDPSSPSIGNSVPSYRELKELIQKEIKKVKTSKGIDEMVNELDTLIRAEKYLSTKKYKSILRKYLFSIDEGGSPKTPNGKGDNVNQDIKTVARSRGISEEMIKFIDRACKAFGFQIMQLDDISLSAYAWVMEKEAAGQKIEAFADWARQEEGGKYIGKYRKNGGEIKNDWVRAFSFSDDRTSMIKRMS